MKTSPSVRWIIAVLLTVASMQALSFSQSMPDPESDAIAHTATVLETMNSAGYTYIRVEEDGIKFWIALPKTQVSVGETISFYEQMLMENFTSRSLERTFDRILFVEAINKGAQLPTEAKALPSPHEQAPEQDSIAQEPQKPEALASPVGRFSIQQIMDRKDDLAGKVIEVKGRVTKVSAQIMGRDWVHIEDGTGTEQDNNNKLIFRTIQPGIAVDDEVVAKGVLFTNKDFGYGYFYPVIVEDAVFSK